MDTHNNIFVKIDSFIEESSIISLIQLVIDGNDDTNTVKDLRVIDEHLLQFMLELDNINDIDKTKRKLFVEKIQKIQKTIDNVIGLKDLKKNFTEMKSYHDEFIPMLSESFRDISSELEQQTSQVDILREKLLNRTNQCEVLICRLENLENENNSMKPNINSLQIELRKNMSDNNKISLEMQRYKSENEQLNAMVRRRTVELEGLKKKETDNPFANMFPQNYSFGHSTPPRYPFS